MVLTKEILYLRVKSAPSAEFIYILIAVSTVKDYSLGWVKCRSPEEIIKLSMKYFAEYYYIITNTIMDISIS